MSGRVQGVGYRFFAWTAAERCRVRGFVRNLPDGRVEVRADGEPEALEVFRAELERGPSGSRVRDVTAVEADGRDVYSSFTIRG